MFPVSFDVYVLVEFHHTYLQQAPQTVADRTAFCGVSGFCLNIFFHVPPKGRWLCDFSVSKTAPRQLVAAHFPCHGCSKARVGGLALSWGTGAAVELVV